MQNATELAEAFGFNPASIETGLAKEPDDAKLAKRLLTEIKNALASRRHEAKAGRASAAQEAADRLGATSQWQQGYGQRENATALDASLLLGACLSGRGDAIVFADAAGDYELTIPMSVLCDFAKLGKRDVTASVSRECLTLRWGNVGRLRILSRWHNENVPRVHVTVASRAKSLRFPRTS